ncbi:MAG: hypothetical protein SGJ21_08580 [Alphaproteobacteria bacterium]|nr:hypothetical protein [Alphaproteobacteria bacterium]
MIGRTSIAALVLTGCAALAGEAHAQRGDASSASAYTGGGNTALPTLDQDNPALHFDAGVKALQAKDFIKAEAEFREVLLRDQRNLNANYMIGLAYLGQEDLTSARKHLRTAVKSKAPEPKGRLGYVEAKLGDAAAANKQREDLVKLDAACKQTCPEAAAIASSILIIDQALAPPAG